MFFFLLIYYHDRCSFSSGLALFGGESKQKETVGFNFVEDCLEESLPLAAEDVVGRKTEAVGLRRTEAGGGGGGWGVGG